MDKQFKRPEQVARDFDQFAGGIVGAGAVSTPMWTTYANTAGGTSISYTANALAGINA